MDLIKIVAEIRFEDSFYFDDPKVKSDLLKNLKPNFPNTGYDETQKFMYFVDEQGLNKLFVQKNRIALDLDNPESLNKIKTLGSNMLPVILNRLNVEATERIGVRANFINGNINTLDETSALIEKSFLNKSVQSFLREHNERGLISNPTLVFHLKLNHEFNMAVNIAAHQTGTGRIDRDGNPQLINIEKTQPMIDLDVYTMHPKDSTQINGVLRASLEYIENYAVKFWTLGE
jgi:hypothetical protein